MRHSLFREGPHHASRPASAHAIRPEALAAAVDRHAADDVIFTTDTGTSTVWLARFVTIRNQRRPIGSFNLGSMANAMPQSLGAAAFEGCRQVIAFCDDGGLTMLMGDLITAVTYERPVKRIVFDNSRLAWSNSSRNRAAFPRHALRSPGEK